MKNELPPNQERQASLTSGRDLWSTAEWPEAHLRSVRFADGPMGIASGRVDERDISVLTPCGHSLGASWDIDLVRRVGQTVGNEARRLGVDALLAPNLNLPRSPLVGRAFEMYSEDPLLAGVLGVAWIEGVASQGVGCVVKHLVCNDSETARDTMNAVIAESPLHEVYLRPFEMAAAHPGCVGVMAAYNRLNGPYCSESRPLLDGVVKQLWKYPLFTVSDWFGAHDTVACANAGLDLDMPGPDRVFGNKLLAAVAQGAVSRERLEEAALRVAAGVRQIDRLPQPASPLDPGWVADTLTESAAAGFVMLRNDGILPLIPGRTPRIAIIGPNAAAPCFQGGTFAKVGLRSDAVKPVDGIRARYAGQAEILFEPGVDPSPRLPGMPVVPARALGDDCTRGMTVEFFGDHSAAGAPLFAETRDTNSLTWFTEMPGIGALNKPGMIRASGWYTPEVDGEYRLYVGGTGSMRLLVDGVEHFAREREIKPSDIMGALKSGEADSIVATLKAGRRVLLTVEMRYRPARAQGMWYGIRAPSTPQAMIARAVAAAREADAVVLMVGETADSGVESKDRDSTTLPAEQLALIDAITAVNARCVAFVNVGHTLDLSWEHKVAALVMCWYPGERFAEALAAVLSGDREPGGRLPVSVAASDADYPVLLTRPDAEGAVTYYEGSYPGYLGMARAGKVPRFPLGAGLGFADIVIESNRVAPVSAVSVRVEAAVRNRSPRAGKIVVQVYVQGPEDQAARLEAFCSVHVAAGAAQSVALDLHERAFARWRAGGWKISAGEHRIRVGVHSLDASFEHRIQLPEASLGE